MQNLQTNSYASYLANRARHNCFVLAVSLTALFFTLAVLGYILFYHEGGMVEVRWRNAQPQTMQIEDAGSFLERSGIPPNLSTFRGTFEHQGKEAHITVKGQDIAIRMPNGKTYNLKR